jgi:hypothetical protein
MKIEEGFIDLKVSVYKIELNWCLPWRNAESVENEGLE